MVNVLDSFMENFDEGKNDNIEITPTTSRPKKFRSTTERVSARRKSGYIKAAKRMAQLRDVASYDPKPEDYPVIMGMLRSHQFPIKEQSCKFNISNQRREDSANERLNEYSHT